jgi:tetratricopeptide (TPR) repeat protein
VYTIRKFVRKHKVMVTAAAAVAATLLLGVIGTTYGMLRARAERDNTIAAHKVLMDMRYAFASNSGGIGTRRERLDELAAKLDAGWLKDQPEIRISVLSALGGVYRGASWYEQAQRHFTAARDLSEQVYGPKHPEVAYQLVLLGWAVVDSKKDYDKAEAYFTRALDIARAQPQGDADLLTYDCLRYLSAVHSRQNRPELARAAEWEANKVAVAWRTRELAHTPDDRELLFGRGLLRLRLGELKDAQADMNRCIELDAGDRWARFYRGVLRLYHDDHAGYAIDRRELLNQIKASSSDVDPDLAMTVATISLLEPAPGETPQDATAFAKAQDIAWPSTSRGPWPQLCRGAADFRRGNWKAATDGVESLRRARSASVILAAESITAMANHRQGNIAAASEMVIRTSSRFPTPATAPTTAPTNQFTDLGTRLPVPGLHDLGSNPEQWLIARILLREAQMTVR